MTIGCHIPVMFHSPPAPHELLWIQPWPTVILIMRWHLTALNIPEKCACRCPCHITTYKGIHISMGGNREREEEEEERWREKEREQRK